MGALPEEFGALDGPSPDGKEGIPPQRPYEEEKGEGRKEKEGTEPPQTCHQEGPEPGPKDPGGGRTVEENVEAGRDEEEEATDKNREPQRPIVGEPASQVKADKNQKGGEEEGCEPEEIMENRLDHCSDGPHDVA